MGRSVTSKAASGSEPWAPTILASVRLATWNVNSVVARLPRLVGWLETARPDVLCLQETKIADSAFPRAEVEALGYELALHGDGRWNGVAILSRVGLDGVQRGFAEEPGFPQPEARALSATCAGLRVWSVYVPNGRTLDNEHYQYKLRWLAAIKKALGAAHDAGQALAVCGDFNIAPTDADVWDPTQFVGSTHVSAAERDALAALVALGLRDVYPRAFKGLPFTYWDYRAGMFHTGKGMRIDLVLLDEAVAATVGDAYIDRDARKGAGPSDHAPVVVDFSWSA
jgi:exodeoxyribonuclease-3